MPEPLADPNVRLLALVDLLLVLKMIALGNYTSFLRLRRQVYATPEDYALRAWRGRSGAGAARAFASRPPRARALPSPAPSPSAPIQRWTTPGSPACAAGAAATSSGRAKGRAPATAAATASPASAARSASA